MSCSEELDDETLKDILTNFAPRMGAKWDFIGIQLRQGDLVQDLRGSPQLGKQKVLQIIEDWLGSNSREVPVCPATVARVLRSDAVRLGAVARDFERVRPNTIVHCVSAVQEERSVPTSTFSQLCVYICSLPCPAIGGAEESSRSATAASSLTSSTRPPTYWSLPSYRRSVCVE